jgi:hypothetical protein
VTDWFDKGKSSLDLPRDRADELVQAAGDEDDDERRTNQAYFLRAKADLEYWNGRVGELDPMEDATVSDEATG